MQLFEQEGAENRQCHDRVRQLRDQLGTAKDELARLTAQKEQWAARYESLSHTHSGMLTELQDYAKPVKECALLHGKLQRLHTHKGVDRWARRTTSQTTSRRRFSA